VTRHPVTWSPPADWHWIPLDGYRGSGTGSHHSVAGINASGGGGTACIASVDRRAPGRLVFPTAVGSGASDARATVPW